MKQAALRDAREALETALAHYRKEGRKLPWRGTYDPYRVFVSEIMLQQTQVDRVKPKFEAFIERYPDWQRLAESTLGDVIGLWSGLGYNRRAKHLHEAARMVVSEHGGRLPRDERVLRTIPGVGPYTASAIRAFAFNEATLCIETNIRSVFIHHCFPRRKSVSDEEIRDLLRAVSGGLEPRLLYSALMDYGAYLKRSGIRLNGKAEGYAKQKPFKGSVREVRGRLLRALIGGPQTAKMLRTRADSEHATSALAALVRDGLVVRRKGKYALA